MNAVIVRNETMREMILGIEQGIKDYQSVNELKDVECPLHHQFAPGAYARTIFIPKHTLVVGKIHLHAHLNMLMMGKVSLATEEGPEVLEALRIMTSKAGTKRVLWTHSDTIWTTIHLTDSTDMDEIEEQIIAKTYEEFDALTDQDVVQLLPLLTEETRP